VPALGRPVRVHAHQHDAPVPRVRADLVREAITGNQRSSSEVIIRGHHQCHVYERTQDT
jgi:hypothetical protein